MRQTIPIAGTLVALGAVTVQAETLPKAVRAHQEMIVTANPLATAAGADALKRGGSAVDAMIAAQAVLGLVEPQSSGIGGGAFVVYYDALTGKTTTFDAREKAPAAASPEWFLDEDGEPLSFTQAWQSGLSVGVPGVPRLLDALHDRYGQLPMRRLFNPAISLAEHGFELTERTSEQVAGLLDSNEPGEPPLFFRSKIARNYFVRPDGTAKPAGTVLRNEPYAKTLRRLARFGSEIFYDGPIARGIVEAVNGDLNIPAPMTRGDLEAYEIVEREPVCVDYRGYEVCGMGPPSSGGIAVGQMLGILSEFDLAALEPVGVEAAHLFAEAGRLAFADRNEYVADSDFVGVPVDGLLDPVYIKGRAALITDEDLGVVEPGFPAGAIEEAGADPTTKDSGTSHISIVDRHGNALSMTTTIESSFGNGVMIRGFLLNNELTDFSFEAVDEEGDPVANRVEANKRPRSSMSPTIVLKNGRPAFLTGSPGGSRIIGYTAQSIINLIDFDLDPQEAVNIPHYMNRNGTTTDLEPKIPGVTGPGDAADLADGLAARGHVPEITEQTSGLSIIEVTGTGLIGGADKRRDGAVGGR